MKCFVAVLGLLAVASATPGAPTLATYSYANPAGVTFRGTGFAPGFAIGPAQPVQQFQYAQAAPALQYAQAAPALQYAQAAPALQYSHAAPAYQYAAAPAVAVTQKVGYTNTQVPIQVPGVADVPVTKLAYTQGVKQHLVDVATPAVTNRRVKVRRPALRKEFYDIEHRVIVRPAGSATLELSQPISKVQKGPSVLTPTTYQQLAPVVRYGNARQIFDGPGVSSAAQIQANFARGIQAGPAPAPQPQLAQEQQQQQQQPQAQEFQRAAPQPQEQQPQGPPPQAQQPQQQQQQQPQPQQYSAAPAPAPAPAPRLRPLQLRPQGPPQQQQQQQQQQQPQQQQPQQRSFDADVIDAAPQPQGPPQQQQQQQQQASAPQQQFAPQGARLDIPQMPVELQARLLELLSAKGGTVTEVLGENGRPNSASVLQVADALQDVNLQGGERITTRRIVVTRPIETEQEVDIQEPATKIHRKVVETPALFKTAIQGVQRVPVSLPGVKNVATPVLQTTYAHAAPAYAGYAHPGYAQAAPAYAGYAQAGLAYA